MQTAQSTGRLNIKYQTTAMVGIRGTADWGNACVMI
jgi:hypothetical protein